MKAYSNIIVKVVIFLLFLFSAYYFFFLKPRLEEPNKLLQTERILTKHSSILAQNRLSFVELTRLDENSANFNLEKSNLVGSLQKTGEDGLKEIEKNEKIPDIDKKLPGRFPQLLLETENIYRRQSALLERVFATGSYKEGIEILKSDEAIEILTDQTNIILEYQFFLDQINKKQEELNISESNNL